jgi:hypothetical protein
VNPRPIPGFVVPVPSPADGAGPRFSICTLVTPHGEYDEMVESFVERGFIPADCEYLYIDNSESNRFDAFQGYNLFLPGRGVTSLSCATKTSCSSRTVAPSLNSG